MDNKVPQAQSLEVKTNGPSPSPSPMNWEPSPSPSQQSSASKRKAQVDNDAQMAIGKVLKVDKENKSRPSDPPLHEGLDYPFSYMESDDLDDFVSLGEALDDANCYLYTNVDEFAHPLDALELHYCFLCKSHLGNYHNVLLSKFLFHLHCVLSHKFKCNFKDCSCFKFYKIEKDKLYYARHNFIQN